MKKIILIFVVFSLILCSCTEKEVNHKEVNNTELNNNETPAPSKTDVNSEFSESSRPSLSEKIFTFKKSDSVIKKDLSKISLIGFDTENYYFFSVEKPNCNYYIANKKDCSIKLLYKTPCKNDIFFNEIYNGKLLIGLGNWDDRTCHFQLISVNNKGEETIIYKSDTLGYPIITMAGNHIILNHIDGTNSSHSISRISTINLDNSSYKEIASSQFTCNMPNYDGTFIMYAGGWDDGFCYEEVKMSNESIEDDDSGTSSIYYYSFTNGKTEKLMDFPYKVIYLQGDKNCFLTSDYLLKSNDNSGRINIRENGTYNSYDIPGVVSGNDIKGSYKLSDKDYLVFNLDNFWIYNIDKKTYYKEKYKYLNENPEDLAYLDIKAYDKQFAYIEPNANKVIVHTFTLQTD